MAKQEKYFRMILDRADLEDAVEQVSKAIKYATTMPIIQKILFQVNPDAQEVRLTGTDLEIRLERCIDLIEFTGNADIESEMPYAVGIPAKLFRALIKEVQADKVTIQVYDTYAAHIETESGMYDLYGTDPEEFPTILDSEIEETLHINGDHLLPLLEKTHFCVSKDDLKPVLQSVRLEFSADAVHAVATDGHRLAHASLTGDLGYQTIETSLPDDFVALLRSHIDSEDTLVLEIRQPYFHVAFSNPKFEIWARMKETTYPDWRSVLPDEQYQGTLDVKKTLNALKRVILFANSATHQIEMHIPSETASDEPLELLAEFVENNLTGREKVEWHADELPDQDMVIGCNGKYLSDILSQCSTDAEFRFHSSIGAMMFYPEGKDGAVNARYLLMPIRIND